MMVAGFGTTAEMIKDNGAQTPRPAPRSRNLLLVEDEADARSVLAHRLPHFGWTCFPHASVESALQDPGLPHLEAVVADVVLGEGQRTGIDLIRALREQRIRAPVVLVTAYADQAHLKDALNAGAAYLLEKPFTVDALREVLERVTRVDTDLARLVDRAISRARLTPKEEQTARLVLKGLSSAEIADVMGISEKTVKQHLTQIYAKTGVAGRGEFFHAIFPG
jgi:DNA-binding NarL/FixJ family response regulator